MTLYLGNELVANSVTVPYNWSGTKAEYEALETINPEWVYYITDDTDVTLSLLETIYPVGSIYITMNSTCPLSALFGTWELITDKFLYASGSKTVGTTGGEETHTLSANEIPSHNHSIYMDASFCAVNTGNINIWKQALVNASSFPYTGNITTNNTGGSQAHNNMPPYLVVNIFKRIA